MKRIFSVLLAIVSAALCSTQAFAQELINFPSGRYYRIPQSEFYKNDPAYDSYCFSLMPADDIAVFYLNSVKIEPYTIITKDTESDIFVFATKKQQYITVGITLFGNDTDQDATQQTLKIKCINRK